MFIKIESSKGQVWPMELKTMLNEQGIMFIII